MSRPGCRLLNNCGVSLRSRAPAGWGGGWWQSPCGSKFTSGSPVLVWNGFAGARHEFGEVGGGHGGRAGLLGHFVDGPLVGDDGPSLGGAAPGGWSGPSTKWPPSDGHGRRRPGRVRRWLGAARRAGHLHVHDRASRLAPSCTPITPLGAVDTGVVPVVGREHGSLAGTATEAGNDACTMHEWVRGGLLRAGWGRSRKPTSRWFPRRWCAGPRRDWPTSRAGPRPDQGCRGQCRPGTGSGR